MPFSRPTLKELRDRTAGDLDAGLEGTNAALRRSSTKVLAGAHAGACHGLHGHIAYVADQILEDKAEGEFLLRRAAIRGLTPLPATFASGTITVTGLNATEIPIDTEWQRADGTIYKSTAVAQIADGTAAVPVVAVVPGVDGNCDTNTPVSIVATLEGVNSDAVTGAIRGGRDDEEEEALRARLLERIRRPPAGGNRYDYIRWAKEITGVKTAWTVRGGQGVGSIDLVILADVEVTGSKVPSPELLAAVRAHIVDICPDGVKFLRVLAPVLTALNLTLSVTPDTNAVRAEVEAEVAAFLEREAAADGYTLPISRLREAISSAPNETSHNLVAPAADVVFDPYELPVPGVFTWQ